MTNLIREWMAKARTDLQGAEQLRASRKAMHDIVCFLCQQAVEKYLKGMLQELGTEPPHTHDLRKLADLLLPHVPQIMVYDPHFELLLRYAVDYRYPGKHSTARQAQSAIRRARQVVEFCEAWFASRIKPRRKRR